MNERLGSRTRKQAILASFCTATLMKDGHCRNCTRLDGGLFDPRHHVDNNTYSLVAPFDKWPAMLLLHDAEPDDPVI